MKAIFSILILMLTIQVGFGQKAKKKADKAYQNLEYTDAIYHYNNYLRKNPDDSEAQINLGDCYAKTNQYYKAESVYAQFSSLFNQFSNLRLDYAFILLSNGKVDQAKNEIVTYLKSNPSDNKANNLLKSCNQQVKFLASKESYNVDTSFFNSEVSDFSPVFYKDGIVYTSEQGGSKDKWTGRSYSNIYFVKEGQSPQLITEGISGKYHNGTPSFISENHMIFTRNNAKRTKEGTYNLMLAEAKFSNGQWKMEDLFPFNNENYNVAYPTVAKNGTYMIFSSDMPGGKGGMDLYVSKRIGDKWEKPTNLASLNTLGNEMFPNINGDELFFSTDGRPGLGGLDLFSAKIIDLAFVEVENLGAPINSSRDDFGLISKDHLKTGYFSSNRDNDSGIDNVYSFVKNKELIMINGIVIDKWTKQPLKETMVTLSNETTGETYQFLTEENGRFLFEGKTDMVYNLQGIKNGILTTFENFDTKEAIPDEPLYYTLIHSDPRFSLEGFAMRVKDKKGVKDVNVKLFNKSKTLEETQVTNEVGFFKFQLDQNSDFEVSGEKNGYYTSVSTASTKGLDRSTTLYVKLFLTIEEIIIGDTKILGKEPKSFGGWEFENIYYDLDKYNIRPDAAIALDKVVAFLNANPSISVELGSHTDCRATDQYNNILSQNRATSAVAYIVLTGVDSGRISAKGYGEARLINRCADGVKCSEDEHQMNRRTEITVTGYKQ